jgi:hypothetical protein
MCDSVPSRHTTMSKLPDMPCWGAAAAAAATAQQQQPRSSRSVLQGADTKGCVDAPFTLLFAATAALQDLQLQT